MKDAEHETEPIVGRVARVLTSRQLVLNRGLDHGVAPGMYFAVYDSEPEEIIDPDTNEAIGQVLRAKVVVRVKRVARGFSVAETFKKERINSGGDGLLGGSLAALMSPPKWEERLQTLRTSESTWEKLPPMESFVKTGDPAHQVKDPDHSADIQDF